MGLDGYARGWVAVRLNGAKHELLFLRSIAELSAISFDRVGVDMPIGLPERGERACDLEARALLRPHASRVFTGARRGLWDHPSHAEANRILKQRGEKGVSVQLWSLGPKICEVDALLTPRLQARIREVHPELVFLRLNGGRPLPSKSTREGLALRMGLLRAEGLTQVRRWIEVERHKRSKDGVASLTYGSGAKADDVLDACAAAIAARDFDSGRVLPRSGAVKDAKRLKMQIWY
ncbi:DUF429 domain-containing protein [Bradyrhizobium sp. LHD-71]|uniref:DUF429 domain-containing protein n=1 Tax=Bradyrhizobium sp. LHD-71 TaxID=3072141 RepID=UPI00280DB18C|nr:DUF429 domain-containing protein [Bradyrhizobium sp. LHD-71]MDQ8732762.1 DUF429 domain-containing protein [Bradyrhizobium sp. LHD-71]